jgi:hypothetical protein
MIGIFGGMHRKYMLHPKFFDGHDAIWDGLMSETGCLRKDQYSKLPALLSKGGNTDQQCYGKGEKRGF